MLFHNWTENNPFNYCDQTAFCFLWLWYSKDEKAFLYSYITSLLFHLFSCNEKLQVIKRDNVDIWNDIVLSSWQVMKYLRNRTQNLQLHNCHINFGFVMTKKKKKKTFADMQICEYSGTWISIARLSSEMKSDSGFSFIRAFERVYVLSLGSSFLLSTLVRGMRTQGASFLFFVHPCLTQRNALWDRTMLRRATEMKAGR